MSHMSQVGGKKVHGTSIQREIFKLSLTIAALAASGYYLGTSSMTADNVSSIRRFATDASFGILHRARDLITFVK